MRQTLYGILAVGLLLFLSSNIYANSTPDCKPSFQIQSVKGNYISLLKGDVERLENFLLILAEQNADYCNASLKIEFKKGLETKQTITHGKPKYNEKLYLEVQYISPSYKVIIENDNGDILHKIELGKELKFIEYSNPKLKTHDALYAEWRRIRRGDFSQIEKDANSFQALIDFLKTENGMSISESQALAINEKKEILLSKGETPKAEKKENFTRENKKSTPKTKKKESKKTAKAKTQPTQKSNSLKIEEKSKSITKVAKTKTKEIVKSETQSNQENNSSEVEKKPKSKPIEKITKKPANKSMKLEAKPTTKISNNKTQPEETTTTELEKYSPPTTSTDIEKTKSNQPRKSSEPREIISDDDMFGAAKVAEPLSEMIEFEFCSKSTYSVINESGFSMQVFTGRENKEEYAEYSVRPSQKGIAKNEFEKGDWYAITYPEKLHLKDLENYKKEIASIWSDLKNPKMESDFNRLYNELNPNLQKIMEKQPNINNQILPVVAQAFEKIIAQTGTQSFKDGQNQEAKDQIQMYFSRLIKSYELFHYYKYTIGSSVSHRPASEILNFKKGSKKKLSPNFILKGSVNWFLFNKDDGFSQYLESWPNIQLNAEIGLPFERTRSKGGKIGAIRPYLSVGYHRQVFKFISPNNYHVGGEYLKNGDADAKIPLALSNNIKLRSESLKLGLLIKSILANKMYFDLGGGVDIRINSKISFDKNTEYFALTDDYSFTSNEQSDVLASGTTPYAQFRFGKLLILGSSSSKKCGTKMKGGFDLFISGYFSKVDFSAGDNYHLYISEFSPTNEMPLVDLAPFKKWYFQLGAGIGYAF